MSEEAVGGDSGVMALIQRPVPALLLLFVVFAVLGLAIHRAALDGAFVSDDFGYLNHPYTADLRPGTLLAIFDPTGPARLYAANYAPIHLLLTAIEKQIFANDPFGYHLVNVLLHAANGALLVALFVATGIPRAAALLGGVVFLVHPANVEAVAWVSQLKTDAALTFSLAALLAFRSRSGLSTVLFASGLLTKASAAFALPTAAVLAWTWRDEADSPLLRWLCVWAAIFVLYAIPQFTSFGHLGEVEVAAFEDPLVQLRTIAAVGMRYLVMAVSGYGVSAFQQPEPSLSWLDPWWLVALPTGALLLWRVIVTLRRGSPEAAWWVAAAVSFAPVSQLLPFLYPVADRYLYFILPGLLGGVLFLWERLRPRLPDAAPRLATWLVLAGCLLFAWQGAARAALWQGEMRLMLDAAAHYPRGGMAAFLEARSAAQQGDVDTAVDRLRWAADHGIDRFLVYSGDPGLAPIRNTPEFRAFVHELAGRWIEQARHRGHGTQPELRMVALAHLQRGELEAAERVFEQALAVGGPMEPLVRAEFEQLKKRRRGDEQEADHRTP